MKTLKFTSGISVISFPLAITYMLEVNVFQGSFGLFTLYLTSVFFFLALGNGMLDTYIFRFIKTEEDRTQLVRVGVGGFFFSLAFICVLLFRM